MTDTHQLIRFDNSEDLGKWYDEKYTEMGGGWKIGEEGANRILDWMGVKTNTMKLLLDVGCGDGDFIKTAANRVSCVGIDLSEVGINFAKEATPAAQFSVADVEVYKHNECFNYVVSLGSIEHCISIPKALKNIHDTLLAHDGIFYVLVPNEAWQHFDQPQETTHTDEEWAKLFTDAGFVIQEQRRNNDLSEFLLTRGKKGRA